MITNMTNRKKNLMQKDLNTKAFDVGFDSDDFCDSEPDVCYPAPTIGRINQAKAFIQNLRKEKSDPEASDYSNIQWIDRDGGIFSPAGKTIRKLPPGYYEVEMSNSIGLYFKKIEINVDQILRFPNSPSDIILDEINKFWERKEIYQKYKFPFKRGMILYGPPGCGKSCCIKLAIKDVLDRKGICINFTYVDFFREGIRVLRQIEPDVPVVVTMEDLDSIIQNNSESLVINILDGVEKMENVLFIATTNYPQRLGDRIISRPSRFDKRIKIDHLNKECREYYLKSLMHIDDVEKIDLEKWVQDTDKFSIAHLKELFISVIILGNEYDATLKELKRMNDRSALESNKSSLGFN